jgi:hypothetical protein
MSNIPPSPPTEKKNEEIKKDVSNIEENKIESPRSDDLKDKRVNDIGGSDDAKS